MNHNLLVSIIIPTFNRSNVLFNTINRYVINQSWKNIEIVIIDDASTDNTEIVIKSINDTRIKYKKLLVNRGCADARVQGIIMSSGNYIAFLDDDDVWKLDYIENMITLFIKNPKANFVISNYIIINNNNEKYCSMKRYKENYLHSIFSLPGPFFQCCVFKKDLFKNPISLFDNRAIPSEDWDFFMTLSQKNLKIIHNKRVGFYWNYTVKSQSANLATEAIALEYIIKKHYNLIIQFSGFSILSDHYRRIARIYEQLDNYSRAKFFYVRAFSSCFYNPKNLFYLLITVFNNRFSFKILKGLRKIRRFNY